MTYSFLAASLLVSAAPVEAAKPAPGFQPVRAAQLTETDRYLDLDTGRVSPDKAEGDVYLIRSDDRIALGLRNMNPSPVGRRYWDSPRGAAEVMRHMKWQRRPTAAGRDFFTSTYLDTNAPPFTYVIPGVGMLQVTSLSPDRPTVAEIRYKLLTPEAVAAGIPPDPPRRPAIARRPGVIEPEAAELLVKVSAMARQDAERWSAIHGEGRAEWTGPGGVARWSGDVAFDAVGRKLWLEIHTRDSVPKGLMWYDPIHVASNGQRIAAELFSPRIHPLGVYVRSYDDKKSGFGMATEGKVIDPRELVAPSFLPRDDPLGVYEKAGASLSVGEPEGQLPTVLVRYQSAFLRLVIDPAFDYRLSRAGLYVPDPLGDVPQDEWEYRWERTESGDVVPREVVIREIAYPEFDAVRTRRFVLDVIRPESALSELELDATFDSQASRAPR